MRNENTGAASHSCPFLGGLKKSLVLAPWMVLVVLIIETETVCSDGGICKSGGDGEFVVAVLLICTWDMMVVYMYVSSAVNVRKMSSGEVNYRWNWESGRQ